MPIRPSRNMSCASARRAPGHRRTRHPLRTATLFTSMLSVSGETEESAPGSHHGTWLDSSGAGAGASKERSAPCNFSSISGGIASARSIIGAAFALLLVGERHRAKGEDFVDLGRVEEIAGAL